ncbi:hypothetical protein SPSIL_030220 [Sporomusa silvacetica DSM 10669]|uniref:GGDEF domain-containing protein n=1 Tax=Sporomusa silvacetica DSM 10669 TaxID=1123289 RepID=A0ABZ3IMH8_9FIRM|nr:GGDEF domain-containing protein [Sporomusa silvacetica]OZC14389.1 putative diguanylate cyclase YdaM [Sporomusa silvacetica DSM 10669]
MSDSTQIVVDFANLSDITLTIINLSRVAFVIANIWLFYSFLTVKNRPIWFQIIAFASTWATINCLRDFIMPIAPNHYWVGYILSLLLLIPLSLVFKETLHAKLFVFFMVSSFSQANFSIFCSLEILVFGNMVGWLLLAGLLLELACIPLIRIYIRPHIKNILDVLDQQHRVFSFFPMLSFALVAFYAGQTTYSLFTCIPLVLFTLMMGFSYYLIAVSIDQTKCNQQLELASRTDSLTSLYNRRHMETRIQEEHERYQRTGVEFALISIDVDLFKVINDRYGHACGDFLLKSVSEDIRKSVRQSDTVARWGGDEFLLLLPGTNSKIAMELAEHISKTVGKHRYVYENNTLSVTLTIGVAVIKSGDTADGIIKNADTGMYQGKRVGRNRVVFFDNLDAGVTLEYLN